MYKEAAECISLGWGGGGADIHIYVFTHHKNNQFRKKLIVQNTNM